MTASAATVTGVEPDLIARREGAAGVIRLNRPKAINAVTLEMFREIDKALDAFESDPAIALILLEGAGDRGLCAGGDIRVLYDSARAGGDLGKILWREEYILNARIAAFGKPYVALMDGIVMGGGVGLAAHASHRVVTERTRLAMPEVGIGFFPDVGGTWLLSRSPGEIGTYFGLTGQTMNGADAVYAGFADVVVASDRLPARFSAQNFQTSDPEPRNWPRQLPRSIGPAGTIRAGRLALVAPMTSAGTVLSQPPIRMTPSAGYDRSASSASIARRLR